MAPSRSVTSAQRPSRLNELFDEHGAMPCSHAHAAPWDDEPPEYDDALAHAHEALHISTSKPSHSAPHRRPPLKPSSPREPAPQPPREAALIEPPALSAAGESQAPALSALS